MVFANYTHRMTVKVSTLVFWTLLHVYRSPQLLTAIRQELRPSFRATQPEMTLGISPQRRLVIDTDGLRTSAPVLQQAIHDVKVKHANTVMICPLQKDVTAGTTHGFPAQQRDTVRMGTFVVFPEHDEATSPLWPQHPSLDALADVIVCLTTGMILTLWDISPDPRDFSTSDSGLLKDPRSRMYSNVDVPESDIRVTISPSRAP